MPIINALKFHKKNPSRNIAAWLSLAILLALGIFFRFHNLEKKVFWYDEIHAQLWATGQSWVEVRDSIAAIEMPAKELERSLRIDPARGPLDVIQAIVKDDPQHTPLYYLLLHFWMRTFGESIWTIRALSVIVGLLIFPCLYWLCCELGAGKRMAFISLALAAVCPFYVIYAQEARQYCLWSVETLLASCLLLRAGRLNRAREWLLYGVTVSAGLYTHLLFATVIAAHATYVIVYFIWSREQKANGKVPLIPFLVAVAIACLTFAPWCSLLLQNMGQADKHLGWSQQKVSLLYLIGMWGYNFSSLLLDTNHSIRFVEQYDILLMLDYFFRAGFLLLMTWALAFVSLRAPHRLRFFVLSLAGVPFLALALPDLFLGGMRSGGGHRFLVPSYLGIMFAIPYLLDCGMNDDRLWARRSRQMLGVLLCAGIVSLAAYDRADTWWTKPISYYLPRISRTINQSPRPLLISNISVDLLTLSHLLAPHVRVLPVRKPDSLIISDSSMDLFVYAPSPALLKRLTTDLDFTMKTVDERGKLWRLEHRRATITF